MRRHDELVEEHARGRGEVRAVGAGDLARQPLVRLRLPKARLEERGVERGLQLGLGLGLGLGCRWVRVRVRVRVRVQVG